MKAYRWQVYSAIDDERDYQDNLGPDRTDGSDKSVGDYLVIMDHYLRTAQSAFTLSPGTQQARRDILKIVAIGVRCLEEHGVVTR